MIRMRLYALPGDNTAAAQLAEVFDVLEDSGDRITRGASALRFRCLTVRIPGPTPPRGNAAPVSEL